ncbi:MAG: hypothetical protein ACTHMC_28600 [Pseudobacter sp.]|uniref:hypothetical protein n=1 Tax=Pseudobacter sp. TaxID=2045420 RepID=UPI003F7F446C
MKIGIWTGFYSFSDGEINKIRGFLNTNFDIQILTFNDNEFTGTVQDDLATGGTEGIGEIHGKIQGNRVDFVKIMPVMTLIVDRKGTRKTLKKKHRPIFYTGNLSENGHTVTGTWKIKFGFVWLGIIPVPIRASRGVWTMNFNK